MNSAPQKCLLLLFRGDKNGDVLEKIIRNSHEFNIKIYVHAYRVSKVIFCLLSPNVTKPFSLIQKNVFNSPGVHKNPSYLNNLKRLIFEDFA